MEALASVLREGMPLNSLLFVFFLFWVVVLYYIIPAKMQNVFLLVVSYLFYGINAWQYGALLLGITAFTYGIGRALENTSLTKKHHWAVLSAAIILLMGILAFFKYFLKPVALRWLSDGIIREPVFAALVLPVGLSFFVFQVVGYLVDVSNRKIKAERNFVRYALFVSFFPQLLSGPIGRAGELLSQYKKNRVFVYENVAEGCRRFLLGAFRKVVVADGLARIVDGIYSQTEQYGFFSSITVMVLFSVQLYADFSGYTDMAVGSAKMLGLNLRENFKTPYLAETFSGFWQRWHMSLTTWLNDYVFTPLVWSRWGNRFFFGRKKEDQKPVVLVNLILVFLLSGIWHGNTWNFVIWGGLQGLLRIGEEWITRVRRKNKRTLPKKKTSVCRLLSRLGVFAAWSATLVFFRAETFSGAGQVFAGLLRANESFALYKEALYALIAGGDAYYISTIHLYLLILGFGLIVMGILDKRIAESGTSNDALSTVKHRTWKWVLYWTMGFAVIVFYFMALSFGTTSFIYAGH